MNMSMRKVLAGPAISLLVIVPAMALGLVAVGAAVTIQNDRFAFTTRHEGPSPAGISRLPMTQLIGADPVVLSNRVVQIGEVTVTGRRWEQRPAPAAALPTEAPQVGHAVAAAPCVDGAYRKIGVTQGVTLNCPER